MCKVGYLCANFGLLRPLCSRLRSGIRDRQTDARRQTDRRQTKASFNASAIWGRTHNRQVSVTAANELHHCDLTGV